MPKVTAGLKSPPEMRKKSQTLTIKEKPKIMEMWRYTETLKPVAPPEAVLLVEEELEEPED